MRTTIAVLAAAFVTTVSAHFQLQYPAPRGVFVEEQEPTFCDGYTNAVSNRTVFPLKNGVISLNSEHSSWTLGAFLSTKQNPSQQSDFNTTASGGVQQLILPYSVQSGEGIFCFPIDMTALGIAGVTDGANVTIELAFKSTDGLLFQCADLTLSSSATTPSGVDCAHHASNVASATPLSSPSSSPMSNSMTGSMGSMTGSMGGMSMSMPSSTAPASATSTSSKSGSAALAVSGFAGLLSVIAAALVAF